MVSTPEGHFVHYETQQPSQVDDLISSLNKRNPLVYQYDQLTEWLKQPHQAKKSRF
jgi:hypothetical protein